MPNWKKLIVSGSDASLNSLNVTNNVTAQSFTGSFSGSFTAPGSTTQIVYNDNGVLAANSGLVYSGSNVGIGISSPTEKLHIVSSATGNQFGRITATDSTASAAWVAQNDQGDNVVYRVFGSGVSGTQMGSALGRSASLLANLGGSGVFLLGTFSNTDFILGTNNTENMRITTAGNVGIGTSSPTYTLDVTTTSATSPFRLLDTTTAYKSFSVNYPSSFTTQLNFGFLGRIEYDGNGGVMDISNTSTQAGTSMMRFIMGTTERMRITDTGNVGIGLVNPPYKLTVAGDTYVFNANLHLNHGYGIVDAANISYKIGFPSLGNFAFENVNVGIGTNTPTAKLEVNGNVKAVSFTGSFSGSITHAVSASYALSSSYALTSSYALSASYAITASHALTASYVNPLNQDLILTGSFIATGGVTASNALINGNLTVIGTASFTYTTASYVNVGASTITLNTDNPAVRFGGINVVDSGSFGTSSTGSLLWDSEKNRWIYSNPSGSTYDGGLLISGPRNTTGLGNEQGTTLNALMKGQGGDHITSSGVFEVSGNVGVGTSTPAAALHIIGSGIVNIVQSTSSVSYTQYYNTSTSTGGTSDGFTVGNNGTDAYVFNRETSNLILGTSDTEAMRITSTGNVGIGTTSPSYKLHVVGEIYASSNLFGSVVYSNTYRDQAGGVISFQDDGGNVGIGTASPTATLEVNGNVKAVSFTGSFSGSVAAPGATTQIVYNDNGVLAASSGLVYSGSNVGIGISSPTEKLHIVSSATGNQFGRITATDSTASAAWVAQNDQGDNVVYRVFGSGVSGTQMGSALGRSASLLANLGGSGVFLLGTFSNTNFVLGTNNTENMRITTAGNVGIGTTSPGYKLDVSGQVRINNGVGPGSGQALIVGGSGDVTLTDGGSVFFGAYDYGGSTYIRGYDSGDIMYFYSNGTNLAYFRSDRAFFNVNVGIGTSSPSYKLEVVGAVSASTYYGDGSNLTNIGSGSVAAAGSDGQLQYNNSGLFGGASRLYYNDSTNRVGIGTSSPGYDLDVSGSARVQDRLRVGVVNTGNGVIHQSSDATINPTSATVVWSVPGSAGICAFIEYYVFNSNTGTSQRAGNIVTTWNASGTPQITHTETTTPDIGSTSPITFSTSLTLGGDPQLIATNTSGNTWYMIMNYRYF